MSVNDTKVPYYVVVVSETERYRLDSAKAHIGMPSEQLLAYAESSGMLIPNDVHAWDKFVRDTGIGPDDRKAMHCYLLVKGGETDEELRRLMDM